MDFRSPIVTFIIILLLPSVLTFITLLIHRIRAARAAQRDRAPQDVVHNLPWRVWTGSGWEKHDAAEDPYAEADKPSDESNGATVDATPEVEPAPAPPPEPSSSQSAPAPLAWFDTQLECAICLCEFEKGDKVRVLPCHHIFHLAEVDEWLITRKKLVSQSFLPITKSFIARFSARYAKRT